MKIALKMGSIFSLHCWGVSFSLKIRNWLDLDLKIRLEEDKRCSKSMKFEAPIDRSWKYVLTNPGDDYGHDLSKTHTRTRHLPFSRQASSPALSFASCLRNKSTKNPELIFWLT